MTTSEPIVRFDRVSVRYGDGDRAVWALRDLSMEIQPGEFVTIMGPSGSGKTTLLNLAAGLQVPDSGRVLVDGQDLGVMSDTELAAVRRVQVAYVFQFFNLLPTLTARENVELPLRANGLRKSEIDERVREHLDLVGLGQRSGHFPRELSGGELQRIAIARALATRARVILADEPTGNLDSIRGEEILELLRQTVASDGRSVVLVTHDPRAAAYGDRMLTLRDGTIVKQIHHEPVAAVHQIGRN